MSPTTAPPHLPLGSDYRDIDFSLDSVMGAVAGGGVYSQGTWSSRECEGMDNDGDTAVPLRRR